MTAPLPFTRFLEDLRRRGLGVGVREAELFYRLLARWEGERISELRDAAAALLARNQAEVRVIRRVFDDTLIETEPEPPPPPPPRRWALGIAAAVAAMIVVSLVAWRFWRPGPPPPSSAPAPPEHGPITVRNVPPPPPPTGPPRPPDPEPVRVPGSRFSRDVLGGRRSYLTFAGAAGAVLLLLAFARRRGDRRQALRTLRRGRMAAVPGPQHFRLGTPPYQEFAAVDLDDLATWLGRLVSESVPSRRLDADRTVRATVRRGRPVLVFEPRPPGRALFLLTDVGPEMRLHRRKVEAFVAGLEQRGVRIERWYFDADAGVVSARPHGPPVPLSTLTNAAGDGALMVVSTGMGVLGERRELNAWVRALAAFPSRVWLNPIGDESAWRGGLARVPMAVLPLSGPAFGRAARALGADVPESAVKTRPGRPSPTDDDVDQLRQLAALLPSVRLELLMWLAETLLPGVSEDVTFELQRRHQTPGRDVLRWQRGERVAALARLRARHPEREALVRQRLVELLADCEPPAGSAAHLRWRLARAEQQAFLSEPARGAAVRTELAALAASPLAEETEELLAFLRETDVAAAAGRARWWTDAGTIRRRARRDQLRGAGLGVRGPRPADLARALAAGVLALGIGVLAHRPPKRVLPNVEGAYQLGLGGPQGSAGLRPLKVSLLRGEASRHGDVFEDGKLLTPFYPADSTGVTVANSAGHWFQFVGHMPSGALALSNMLQMPAPKPPPTPPPAEHPDIKRPPLSLTLILPAGLGPRDVLIDGHSWSGKPIGATAGDHITVEIDNIQYDYKRTFEIAPGQRRIEVKAKQYGLIFVQRPKGAAPNYKIDPPMQEVRSMRDIETKDGITRTYRGSAGVYSFTAPDFERRVSLAAGDTDHLTIGSNLTAVKYELLSTRTTAGTSAPRELHVELAFRELADVVYVRIYDSTSSRAIVERDEKGSWAPGDVANLRIALPDGVAPGRYLAEVGPCYGRACNSNPVKFEFEIRGDVAAAPAAQQPVPPKKPPVVVELGTPIWKTVNASVVTRVSIVLSRLFSGPKQFTPKVKDPAGLKGCLLKSDFGTSLPSGNVQMLVRATGLLGAHPKTRVTKVTLNASGTKIDWSRTEACLETAVDAVGADESAGYEDIELTYPFTTQRASKKQETLGDEVEAK